MEDVLLFGGTFDPPHLGHFSIANEVMEKLNIKRVILLPVGNPPHKALQNVSEAKHRLNMLKLAVEGQKGFEVSDIEIKRKGYTYTIDTLRELSREGKYRLFYLIGADTLENISKWKNYKELFNMCEFVVVPRKGYTKERLENMILQNKYNARVIDINCVDISSTDIRKLIKNDGNVGDLIFQKVEEYIKDNNLYRK